jgi:hypothetical protein
MTRSIISLAAFLTASAAWAGCPPLPGDVSGDGATSVVDVQCTLLVALWELGASGPLPLCAAAPAAPLDFDCDGAVAVSDVQLRIFVVLGLPLPQMVDFDSTGCPDACEPECTSPADCDDGFACNGQESCSAAGTCTAGQPPCGEDAACSGAGVCTPLYPQKRVGAFYLVWHAYAARAMAQQAPGSPRTIEQVIRSGGAAFSQMLWNQGLYGAAAAFHYQVEPSMGFYCLYRPRPGEAPYPPPDDVPACANISEVAKKHAELLWAAGVDFVYVDLTNIPFFSPFADVLGVRPLEVLFEEWAKLRAQGTMTPQIAAWVPLPPKSDPAAQWTYRKVLDIYNNPAFSALVLRDPKSKKKVLFGVENGGFPLSASEVAWAQANQGKNDVVVSALWGNLSGAELASGRASWMQPCMAPGPPAGALQFTTLVHHQNPCLQGYTTNNALGTVLSVSTSYQIGYASLPFQAAGRNEGLTLVRQFARAFAVQPDYLLINSWNEHIAQPQSDAGVAAHGTFGRSMGMTPSTAADVSAHWLWVDGYGAEFSRDLEPTVEYGTAYYDLLVSCLSVYRTGGCVGPNSSAPCCQSPEVYRMVYSLRQNDADASMDTDHVPTTSFNEMVTLLGWGLFEQVCNPFYGPPSICGTAGPMTGDSPFMLYAQPGPERLPVFRCFTGVDHIVSNNLSCEGQTPEGQLGYASTVRTSATPRPLSRCLNTKSGTHFHWLAETCPALPNVKHEYVLGFVR